MQQFFFLFAIIHFLYYKKLTTKYDIKHQAYNI